MTLIQSSFLSLLLREVPSSSLNIERLKDGNDELCRLTHMLKCMLENYVLVDAKPNNRTSRPKVFCEKVVLRNFTKFKGRHLWPEACNFMKKEALTQVFPVNFVKFLRTPKMAASITK